MVRQLSLRALSHVADLHEDQRSRHCSFVFSALMQGLDDPEARCNTKQKTDFVVVTPDSFSSTLETNVPLEAMLGLSKMLHAIDERQLDAIQVSTAVRIKPFYEKEDYALRSAAFRLFGDLAMSFGSNYHVEAFREQVSANFICLLLHLSDDNAEVVKVCINFFFELYLQDLKVFPMFEVVFIYICEKMQYNYNKHSIEATKLNQF